jgi:hypothetical protein
MKRRAIFPIVLLLFALVPLTRAQGSTFDLSPEDYDLFTAAHAASAGVNAFQFEYSLSFALIGIPEGSVSIDVSGGGAVDSSGDSPALQLTLNGSASAPQETPIQAELRLVDNVLYINAPDPTTGAQTWQGISTAELTSFAQAGFVPGLPTSGAGVDSAQLSSAVAAAFATLDPSEFITISRLEDEAVGDVNTTHFSTNFSLTDFAGTDAFAAILTAAASAGGTTSLPTDDLSSIPQMVGMIVSNSAITVDEYFGAEDQFLHRAGINVALELNPAMLGLTEPLNLALNLDVTLSDHNQPQTITAPEGVEITSITPPQDVISAAPTITLPAIPTVVVPTVVVPTLQVLASPTPTNQPQGAVIPTTASSTGTITANTPVEVQLTGSGAVDVRYTGNVNEVISVTARSLETSGVLDTTLEVLDSSNTRLGYNDDHGSTRTDLDNFDSYIRDLKLTSGGELIIRVSTFTGAGAGRVEVLLTSSLAAAAPTQTPSTPSTGPEVVTGAVPEGGTFDQTIAVQSGEVLTITVRATDNALDPKVALVDASGSILVENDDHGTNDATLDTFDSRISNFTVTTGGTFTIQISGFAGSGGSFEMTIERSGGSVIVPSATPLGAQTPSTPTTSETVTGSINLNETYTYELNGQAGDVYTITARALSNDFDPRLSVYGPNEDFLFANDDHGSSTRDIALLDSRIFNLILPETGRYLIDVNGYQDSAGEFSLIIEQVATGAPLGRGTDQVFTGEVRANGTFTQTFDGQAGDYVTITARSLSQDFDPSLLLLSPDDVVVADNDDHGTSAADVGFLDSRIHNFIVPETGTYTIEVQGFQGSAGSFALTITTLQ